MTAGPAATSRVDDVLAGIDGIRSWQEDLYRDLHSHPELSHEERRTPGLVAGVLAAAGFDLHERVGGTGVVGTGVVGVLGNGEGPTVLLRADMDALPVRAATVLPYASSVTTDTGDGRRPR